MIEKALILYDTNYGSTKEIAEKINYIFIQEGLETELSHVNKAPKDISNYDFVLVGSGIRIGKWKKNAEKFIRKNAQQLNQLKTALFVSCGDAEYPERQEEALSKYLKEPARRAGLSPIAYGLFGGVYDFTSYKGFVHTIVMNSIKKEFEERGIDTSKPYDFRDWSQITQWTRELIHQQNVENSIAV